MRREKQTLTDSERADKSIRNFTIACAGVLILNTLLIVNLFCLKTTTVPASETTVKIQTKGIFGIPMPFVDGVFTAFLTIISIIILTFIFAVIAEKMSFPINARFEKMIYGFLYLNAPLFGVGFIIMLILAGGGTPSDTPPPQ